MSDEWRGRAGGKSHAKARRLGLGEALVLALLFLATNRPNTMVNGTDTPAGTLTTSCVSVEIGLSSDPVTSSECAMAGGSLDKRSGMCIRTGNDPQTFTYAGDDGDKTVLFKYGELVERATQYKLSIKDTAADHPVHLYFAIYKLALNVWTCVDPSRPTYGTTSGWSSGCTGEGDSKLIYKFVVAARAGVEVRVVFHNPDGVTARGASSAAEHKIWDYLTTRVSSLPPTFQIHRADWKDGGTYGQMHNKFLLVSHHRTPNDMLQVHPRTDTAPFSMTQINRYTHSTYVTSQNVDAYGSDSGSKNTDLHLKDYVQTGVLVRGNEGLYSQYVKYFQAIWNHTLPAGEVKGEEDADTVAPCTVETCTRGFRQKMRQLHEDPHHPINYDGGDVQAFFYPLPDQHRIWDPEHNAVAKYVDRMAGATAGSMRYFKMNMYHWKNGAFLKGLLVALRNVPPDELHARIVYTKDSTDSTLQQVRDLPPQGGNLGVHFHDGGKQLTHPKKSGKIRPWNPGKNKKTHAKAYNLYYQRDGVEEWVTITGSTNGKDDAYNRKANSQIVFVERLRDDGKNPPIYAAHKVALYKAY